MIRVHRRPTVVLLAALALLPGIVFTEFVPVPVGILLAGGWLTSITALVLRTRKPAAGFVFLLLSVAFIGAIRSTLAAREGPTSPLRQLTANGDILARFSATVASVPAESEAPASALSGHRQESRWRTRFLVHCRAVELHPRWVPADGLCRVFVDGRTGNRIQRGDEVTITGRLSWPRSPGNPGEFDFETFLRRRRISGLLFVKHPHAVTVDRPAGVLSPGYWLTQSRRAAHRIIEQSIGVKHRGIALALLLGDRSEVRQETEEAFVGSGTMHLLAISGLHIGILCLLLIRIFHGLLIPWNRALLLTVGVCVTYAFVTDLRPSVVRATVFVSLFAASQIVLRGVNVFSVIGLTAFVMAMWQPWLVFDTGAWLSFLSVTALGFAAQSRPAFRSIEAASRSRPVPLTAAEKVGDLFFRVRWWLAARYRPMLWILAATVPLTAWDFHVLSPVSLLVNVLLIPVTAVALWLGFATIAFGFLLPSIFNLPGLLFATVLEGLLRAVQLSCDLGIGHLYLPDLPLWFLPTSYCLLAAAMMPATRRLRQAGRLGLLLLGSGILLRTSLHAGSDFVRCTILDVGHGSAAVLESAGGGVILIDAGAMNRGDRAGDIICHCLWNRGYRTVNSVLVSHADVDHFNGLATLMARFPVGELLVSQQFVRNESEAAARLLELAADHNVGIRIVTDGTTLNRPGMTLHVFQAAAKHLETAKSDNEKSLVVQVTSNGHTICLPGDLEGEALVNVLPRLGLADVLVSPHHGSLNANIPKVAETLTPKRVVVSARDDRNRGRLEQIYPESELLFTSGRGAITVELRPDGARPTCHRR